MLRTTRSLVAVLVALSLAANAEDLKSWSNLNGIAVGQSLEVRKLTGGSARGNYAAHSEQTIDLSVNGQKVSIARDQISEIRMRPRTRKAMWIGFAAGAGAGAAIGAGIGSRFEQSGDFGNATGVAAAILAGVGALVGLAVGSSFAQRHTIIYRVR